jgi:DNA recombination protein RmuC
MESDVTPLSILLIFSSGAFAGALLTVLLLRRSSKPAPGTGELAETAGESRIQAARAEAVLADSQRQLAGLKEELSALQQRLTAAESARAGAEARCCSAEKSAQEQALLLDRAKELMSDAFSRLASDVLASNSSSFFAMMDQKLAGLRVQTEQLWEEKRSAIDHLLRPLNETLSSYQKETRELQGTHIRDLGAVGEQLKSLACAQLALQSETARLVNALKSPQVRGRWGQVQLRRLVELSGMSLHCDFTEEHSVTGRQGRFRPDMVVHLPAEREVVVDAKVPLSAYLEALEALTEADKRAALHRHVLQVREHLRGLSAKQYWEQFAFTPEFVVMFIPNDSFLSAAVEIDPELIEAAIERNVILATPSTLIALLKAIAFGWRQEKASESAQRIRELGEELSERLLVFVDHVRKLGACISRSVENYNAAVGALETRVLVSARRFREFGAGGNGEIAEPEPVDVTPRVLG